MQRYESSSTPLEENMRCAWTEHKQRVYQQRCLQQFDFLHQKYIELKGARMIDVDHVDVTVSAIDLEILFFPSTEALENPKELMEKVKWREVGEEVAVAELQMIENVDR